MNDKDFYCLDKCLKGGQSIYNATVAVEDAAGGASGSQCLNLLVGLMYSSSVV